MVDEGVESLLQVVNEFGKKWRNDDYEKKVKGILGRKTLKVLDKRG
jgi:hypothetical protein